MSRRSILKQGSGLTLLSLLPQLATARVKSLPLTKDKDGLLDLAEGFSYQVISRYKDLMTDGYTTPALPDGMAVFAGEKNQVILMRNHEIDGSTNGWGAAYPPERTPAESYASGQYGGVTRLVYDLKKRKLISHNLVLTGTSRNCAGGMSPWGWLSCEETYAERHGYVFLCRTDADKVRPPQRIDVYGKFMHEAVAIDPATAAAYLTEDRGDGCFYRFLPADPKKPFERGEFAALGIKGKRGFDTSRGVPVGETLPVEWVKCEDQVPSQDTLRATMIKQGAARVRRGEGVWFQDGQIYFTATEGGSERRGQIWRYDVGSDTLTLLYESKKRSELNMPDNLTMHPGGNLFICEDGKTGEVPYIRYMNQKQEVFPFVRNRNSDGEFAGVCFAPDGETMFFNMQKEGLTIAVHGPFASLSKA